MTSIGISSASPTTWRRRSLGLGSTDSSKRCLSKSGILLYLPVLNSSGRGPSERLWHEQPFSSRSIDELRITRRWVPKDLLDGGWPDCNQTVPDAIDLQAATSADCNSNFVPDECDVASGASALPG